MESIWNTSLDLSLPKNLDRQLLFEGKVITIQNLDPLLELVEYLQKKLKKYFGIENLQKIHEDLGVGQFNEQKMDLNNQLVDDENIKKYYRAIVVQLGWDKTEVNFDRPIIRLNPPLEYAKGGVIPLRSFTKIHRDTWGVNIMGQINWWAPLFPVTEENSLALYPSYWETPLKNTTAEWSFGEYLKKKSEGYPTMPIALEEVGNSQPLILTPEPGELLLFSAAHLHGSVTNTTPFTRINFETRCYFDSDLMNNIGAPNVDTQGAKPVTKLFYKI